ncbi:isoleucine--tRNA ligase [Halorubellus sp. JP-L1]|uniref:isoleucine--tRNA ligase n=1 Tax=Halorubellus sp. JP-L1 TaxID=2715753 RepID=UPI00140E3036|nr:isoleucine--tRNA ligase [Halorubellus sp. JP-L1]NHN41778.1 isoleucine--tRNA ligase [Halorubellus sp. JP-L1]
MERFEEVADQYDPDAVEDRVFEHWDAVDAYEQTRRHREGEETFFFVDGPPYTSGAAHMGTTWNKTLKDAFIRYYRMQGFDVTDRPGYDMHGLPIETRVEENLGFENKKDIEEFGVENFIEECKDFADDQLEGLQSDFQSFGVWMDWENPYKTVNPEYMEAAWFGFEKAHQRGLVEQGQRSINQCPRCETAIANNEVERHDVHKPAIYVQFPLVGEEGSLVIWTTTPWTIPANTFVAVEDGAEYAKVRAEKDGESDVLWVSASQVEEVLKAGRYDDYEVLETVESDDLVGKTYEYPLPEEVPEHAQGEGAGEVYTAEYADASDKSGMVHSAPGHGEEDFERGRELDLEIFCPVESDGRFGDSGGKYAGQFVRDANENVITDLDAKGLLLAHDENYLVEGEGQCWRCDTDIVRLVTDQWFITVSDIKDELLANIEDSEWHPSDARDNRFRDFVEGSPDWNVSRQRYWGIPIPIWTCDSDDCDHLNVVDTRETLADRVHQDVDPDSVDLHKPTVDDLTMDCEGCGAEATRVPDVFDVWLDSSVASWGTLDYPEDDSRFDELWPADLIMEAHDQTRGWFWSQLGMGTAAFGEIPYEEVLMHGWALMPDGRTMSKSKGILVDPQEVIDEYGVDPMRGFLLSQNPQGSDMKFSWDGMDEMQRDLNILWNVFRFPLPYMEMDGFVPGDDDLVNLDTRLVDEWVLARLQSVEREMTEHWEDRRPDKALDALLSFVVEDVSRFYVQAIRERVWEEDASESKLAAYATVYEVLHDVVALLAPFAPFVADEMYATLTGDTGFDTVHMRDWPAVDETWVDEELEADVELLRAIEESGSNARQQADRKLRWPVARVVVAPNDERTYDAVDRHRNLLAERLNAREIELVEPEEQWGELAYSARADMSELGPAFGDRAGEVMEALNEVRVGETDLDALRDAVGEPDVAESMVEFETETPDGVAGSTFDVAGDTKGVVYVDTTLTEDIESEGYAREVIRRVQEMRKDLELDVDEHVHLSVDVADDRIAGLVDEHRDLVAEETRGTFADDVDGHTREWDVEGVAVTISVEPVAEAEA